MHWLFSIVFSLSTAFPFLTSIWMTFEWLNSTINCWKEIQSFYIPRVLAGLRISAYCLDNRIIWLRIEFDNTAFSRNFRDIALWYLHTECLSLRLLHQWLYWLDLIAWYFFPQEELKSALVLEVFHIWKYLPLALIFEHQCDSSVHSPGGPSTQLATWLLCVMALSVAGTMSEDGLFCSHLSLWGVCFSPWMPEELSWK